MTSLGNPLMQQLLAQIDVFYWLMDVRPRRPSVVETAHVRRAELASLDAHTQRDSGMSAQDATGISSYQPDLPFFMQSGFR